MMSSSSSSSATVRVEKATSDLLIGPDWTMNMEICDSINSNYWDAKDVVKAVKKRLQHKNPKVQLLALTLLETMVKNCGDYVHFQIADRNILPEMIKIVKKKTDMHVRDKILVLIDSWQEAFGGPGGKYPQYYWAYEELRRFGVVFPPRSSSDGAPIFTPPVTHSTLRHAQAGYGMPSNSSTRLDEAMAAEIENLSLSSINSMRNVLDLLADMLQAVNPSDRASVKDEVIVDLVNQCRSNQKKLMQMLTTTGDEDLLGQGLELNDSMQIVLAKHDAIASGSPLPTQVMNISPNELNLKSAEAMEPHQKQNASPSAPIFAVSKDEVKDEDDDEEDDFAQLARRHSKPRPTISQDTSTGSSESFASVTASTGLSSMPAASVPVHSNALVLRDPPAPVRNSQEQDMIDLLSLALTTTTVSPETPYTPGASENTNQAHVSSTTQGYSYTSQAYPENQGQVPFSSYVVPWAQPQPEPQCQPYSRPLPQTQTYPQAQAQSQSQLYAPPQPRPQSYTPPQPHSQTYPQAQAQAQTQTQAQSQSKPYTPPQTQSQTYPQAHAQSQPYSPAQLQTQSQPPFQPQSQNQTQPRNLQHSSGYPPPPWAPTPGYLSNQNHFSSTSHMYATARANTTASYMSGQGARPVQHGRSFPLRGSNGLPMNGETGVGYNARATVPAGQKPFIPSYRLFEDLNVLGNGEGRLKMTSGASNLSGTPGQSMVGGRK